MLFYKRYISNLAYLSSWGSWIGFQYKAPFSFCWVALKFNYTAVDYYLYTYAYLDMLVIALSYPAATPMNLWTIKLWKKINPTRSHHYIKKYSHVRKTWNGTCGLPQVRVNQLVVHYKDVGPENTHRGSII